MKLFTGIHEVVCKRADGKLYIGFFDDPEKALASVENDSTYPRSGTASTRSSSFPTARRSTDLWLRSNRSKKDWISKRERLLVDIDPIREYGNANESEKGAAQKQALAIRDHLGLSDCPSRCSATVATAITWCMG